jgi:hypothetical protein
MPASTRTYLGPSRGRWWCSALTCWRRPRCQAASAWSLAQPCHSQDLPEFRSLGRAQPLPKCPHRQQYVRCAGTREHKEGNQYALGSLSHRASLSERFTCTRGSVKSADGMPAQRLTQPLGASVCTKCAPPAMAAFLNIKQAGSQMGACQND